MRLRIWGWFFVLTFITSSAAAAQTLGAIAGTVTDATGAVLPGVTVEASSPALIEGVRSAVTDGQGRYNIINLAPGTYTVTFTLAGFSVVKREGVTLTQGFTAPVNADMRVGALEETVTVTGASPVVDVQNVRTQNVLTRETLDALPNAQNLGGFAALTLGADFGSASGTQDVGGAAGEQGTVSVHANRASDQKYMQDGMNTNNSMGSNGGAFHAGQHYNMEALAEVTMAHSGMSAETETAGVQLNHVPKDGGNKVSGSGRLTFVNESMQSSNLTDELRARGTTTPPTTKRIWDYGGGIGGPFKRDKLWFFTAHRWWGNEAYAPGSFYNKIQGSGRYEADTDRRGYYQSRSQENSIRLTLQASRSDKIAYYGNYGNQCSCFQGVGVTTAPEASFHNELPKNHLSQVTWNRVQTSRLLIEGGFTFLLNPFDFTHVEGVGLNDIPRTEQSTGFTYNARPGAGLTYTDIPGPGGGMSEAGQQNARGSLSYVTGSHAFKTGFQWAHGLVEQNGGANELPGFGPVAFRLLNGVPNQITIYATPKYSRSDFRNMGFYVQDQWSLRSRVTLNMGVRFDVFDGWSPDQETPAGAFVPAFRVSRIEGTPTWRDVSPRLGVAYDVGGNGKTAIKASIGRYVAGAGAGNSQSSNPILSIVSSATRIWTDADNDLFPDANELGPISNTRFGTVVPSTTRHPDVLTDNRPYTWQMSVNFERELRDNMGVSVGYFRTSHYNQTVTDNTLTTPADYDQFCVTAPVDARLPGGGGNQICGQYNISFAKAGQSNSLVVPDKVFGDTLEQYNGVDLQLNSRFPNGATLQGGVGLGRTVNDSCYVIDSPQQLFNCRVVGALEASTQVKINGLWPLPGGIEFAAVYQNLPGVQISANATFSNAQVAPSLGRNLSACPAPTGACNANVTVSLIEPSTMFEERVNQLDIRAAKLFRGLGRIRITADVYNLFNSAPVQSRNNTFGPLWGTPNRILTGRLFKFGAQYTF